MIYRSWRRSNSSAIRGKRTLGRQSQSVERVSVHSPQGDHHGDSGRANEILRERERRGLRRFTIDVSEDDLGVIAEHGYEVPQAPTRISRRKPSVSSSPTCSPPRSAKGTGALPQSVTRRLGAPSNY